MALDAALRPLLGARFSRLGLQRPELGWLEAGFLAVMTLALVMRLWELGGRTMHYDEAIHLHFSWRLLQSSGAALGWPWVFGTDYIHSPWMHGPFQIEFTAFIFRIFGDSDVTARLGYVLFGTALVGLPYFLRDYLGRHAAFFAAVMLALSPSLLYFSRFGRNDIIMAFWATALLILMWRYLHGGKHRYLYLASAVLAFMFATKETAYLVTAIFGALVFLLALPNLVPWALGRVRLAWDGMPAGFLLLLLTLTLPQWAAVAGLAQGALGLTLANPDPQTGQNVPNTDGTDGLVGAPAWAGDTLLLPVYNFPWGLHLAAVALGLGVLFWLLRRGEIDARRIACLGTVPLLATAAVGMVLFRPLQGAWSAGDTPLADLVLAALFAASAVAILTSYRYPWRRSALLIAVPVLIGVVYSVLFTPVVNLQATVDTVLPTGVTVGAESNGIPANYVVALLLLVGALIVSVVAGIAWLGGRWLICAGIFYFIWAALYTTLFTHLAGLFSGSWQGVGYWIAQQDVARGNQPWYYYFVGLSVYELLPVAFGIVGAVYFLRRGDALGLALTFWALVTFLAYTLASEKMPWLLVNITLPFILLAAKFLGELAERVRWRRAVQQGAAALLLFAPLAAIGGVYVLFNFVGPGRGLAPEYWALLASTALLAAVSAYLIRTAAPGRGAPIAGLGLAALLLAFGTWGAVRATYTFDDSNKEVLVYAQGGSDLEETYEFLASEVFPNQGPGQSVRWDYDVWYPFQWYVRDNDRRGELRFGCFKREGEDGWNDSCDGLEIATEEEGPDTEEGAATDAAEPDGDISAMVLTAVHADREDNDLDAFQKDGPYTGLLWFPETYRRPSENRQGESFTKELTEDFPFFRDQALSKRAWRSVLDYVLFRNLEQDWFSTEYYRYLPESDDPDNGPP